VSREGKYSDGDYWLDKRRDGKSPDIWQIATYRPDSRQIVYRSTKCRSLEDAKGALHAYAAEQRATKPQTAEAALLVAGIMQYWKEHGRKAERPDSIACSIRHFLGFLLHDGNVGVTIAQLDRSLTARFIAWRMGSHSYSVEWGGKTFRHESKGVKGETVHSDLARIGAAINRQLDFGRIPMAPKLATVDKRERSGPRETLLTIEQMGAILAVAAMGTVTPTGKPDPDGMELFRWLAHQAATCGRPVAALAFDPREQCDFASGLVDLHPKGKARTRKRNPIVPMIEEMRPIYKQWAKDGVRPAASRKRAWRTIRRVLDLPQAVEPKTLRYSIATELRRMGTVPAIQLESLLGHEAMKGVTARYAKYDPLYMAEAKAALSITFRKIMTAAMDFAAVHRLSKTGNRPTILLDRTTGKAQISLGNGGAAYRTRTCDPRITNARKGRKTAVSRDIQRERSGD
jgi:integrase